MSIEKPETPIVGRVGYAKLDDSALLDLAVRRDAYAVEALVRRYTPLLTGYLRSRVPRHYEDVYQETFAVALAKLDTLRQRDRFGPWLLKIASRVLVDWVRADARHAAVRDRDEVVDALHGSADVSVVGTDSAMSDAQLVIDTIFEQPETFRLILYLNLIHEKGPLVIAQELGIRPGTVRMRLKRGLSRLRKSLEIKGLRGFSDQVER